MPEILIDKPHLVVKYLPERFYLSISWNGIVEEQELLNGYQEVLALLRKHPVSRIMLDLSKRKKLDFMTNPKPVFSVIFQQALEVIKRPLFLAMVLNKEEYYLTSESSLFGDMRDADNEYVITQLFSDCMQAQNWLAMAN